MSDRALIRRGRATAYYWPQAGLGLGVLLNVVGAVTENNALIATASNMLVLCGLFLGQRRRNDRRGS